MSYLPPVTPGMMLSNLATVYSVLTPSLAAMASMSSTSQPMGAPLASLYSLGG